MKKGDAMDENQIIKHDDNQERLLYDKFEICRFRRWKIDGKFHIYGQIKALRDVDNLYCPVKKGEVGGWILIDGTCKLSQDDESWIDENSIVGKGCYISGDGTFIAGSVITGVRAYDESLVINSQVFSKDTALHGNVGIYDTTIKNCDVHMEDDAQMSDCIVCGKYLSMKNLSTLNHCVVKSFGEGISMVEEQALNNKVIEGQGSIYGNRVDIKTQIDRNKGSQEK